MPRLARTSDGYRLRVSRTIDAPPEAAWELLTDTRRWPDWGPSVRAVECDRRWIEDGTTGHVRLPGGLWLPFEIDTCSPYRWTWRVARLPATGHSVEAASGDGCVVCFELPLAAVGYTPVCGRALDRIESILTGDRAGETND